MATRLLALALLVAAVGCSKNDVIVDYLCPPSGPPKATDPAVVGVLSYARGRHFLDGTWQNGRTGTVMTIDLETGASHVGQEGYCPALVFDMTSSFVTRDGVLDARGAALSFGLPLWGDMRAPLPALPEAYAHPDDSLAPIAPEWNVETVEPTLFLNVTSGTIEARIVLGRRVLGYWTSQPSSVPFRRPPAYVVPAELAAACAPAVDFTGNQFSMFASADAAVAAETGTWIRCRAYGGPDHDGIQISPDRTWRHVVWSEGHFVTRTGVQHEGKIGEVIDLHASGFGDPGVFQVNLDGPGTWHATNVWENRLIVDAPSSPADVHVDVYVRTDLPVTAAVNPYEAGERGGKTACGVPETGTIDPNLVAPLEATLAGDWALCSGEMLEGFTRLHFDGQGSVSFVDDLGHVLATRSYAALQPVTMPTSSPRYTVLQFGEAGWQIVLSERPLKLWIATDTSPATNRVAVFSAVP